MKYKAVIFDFDYTLADATEGIVGSINYALSSCGLPQQERETIRKTIGMTLEEMLEEMTGVRDPDIFAEFERHFLVKADEIMTDNTVLFPHTVGCLEYLRKNGIKAAIVTNKRRKRIEEALEKNGIAGLVALTIGAEDSVPKPDPTGLLRAVDMLSVPSKEVLFVGDSLIDAKTARNANISFMAVTTGTTTREDFEAFPHAAIVENLSIEQISGYLF